jgi:hypothetical protein
VRPPDVVQQLGLACSLEMFRKAKACKNGSLKYGKKKKEKSITGIDVAKDSDNGRAKFVRSPLGLRLWR